MSLKPSIRLFLFVLQAAGFGDGLNGESHRSVAPFYLTAGLGDRLTRADVLFVQMIHLAAKTHT